MPAEGFTDDLSVNVAPHRNLDDVVTYVLEAQQRGTPPRRLVRELMDSFWLSEDDAWLCVDRVSGGIARAGTIHPGNAPDPKLDPVARASYERARGQKPVAPRALRSSAWGTLLADLPSTSLEDARRIASGAFDAAEREALALWLGAVEATGRTRGVESMEVALCLVELAQATPRRPKLFANVLLQTGTGLSGAIKAAVRVRPACGYAPAGTPLWFQAHALFRAALQLASIFREIGDTDNENGALDLRGQAVTRLLGHCPDLVGAAMLDSIRALRHRSEVNEMLTFFESMADDFEGVIATCLRERACSVQTEAALELLLAAMEEIAAVQGIAPFGELTVRVQKALSFAVG